MKSSALLTFILFLTLLSPAMSMAEDVVIISNESVPTSTLDNDDIKKLFLGKKTTWEDGTKIVFLVQEKTEASEAFLEIYVKKSSSQYNNYWKKQVFTGKGKAPQSFSSDQELVDFVSKTPGAIGYVLDGTKLENVKTIDVK